MADSQTIRALSAKERVDFVRWAKDPDCHDFSGELGMPPGLVLGTIAYIESLESLLRQINEAPSEGECMRLISTIDAVLAQSAAPI